MLVPTQKASSQSPFTVKLENIGDSWIDWRGVRHVSAKTEVYVLDILALVMVKDLTLIRSPDSDG